MWGSSPRVRGRPRDMLHYESEDGAHPRECGADENGADPDLLVPGSSPRVRGRHKFQGTTGTVNGLIPASAGQTAVDDESINPDWAHPRECGADHATCSTMRVRMGLIPASAGQTGNIRQPLSHRRAHPRECGADRSPATFVRSAAGSSPRVRGRQSRMTAKLDPTGLIPASAGQTMNELLMYGTVGAHPRECGADSKGTKLVVRGKGSSPRVRGRLPQQADVD